MRAATSVRETDETAPHTARLEVVSTGPQEARRPPGTHPGYHPVLALSASTGDVIHVRLRHRAANTQYGAARFFTETIARCRRAGHQGAFLVRADSRFGNYELIRHVR